MVPVYRRYMCSGKNSGQTIPRMRSDRAGRGPRRARNHVGQFLQLPIPTCISPVHHIPDEVHRVLQRSSPVGRTGPGGTEGGLTGMAPTPRHAVGDQRTGGGTGCAVAACRWSRERVGGLDLLWAGRKRAGRGRSWAVVIGLKSRRVSGNPGDARAQTYIDNVWRQTLVLDIALASEPLISDLLDQCREPTHASSKPWIASLIPSAPDASSPAGSCSDPEMLLSSDTRSDSSLT